MPACTAIVLVDLEMTAGLTATSLPFRTGLSTLMAMMGIDRDFDAFPSATGLAPTAATDATATMLSSEAGFGRRSKCFRGPGALHKRK
jgi:hypothetical protein